VLGEILQFSPDSSLVELEDLETQLGYDELFRRTKQAEAKRVRECIRLRRCERRRPLYIPQQRKKEMENSARTGKIAPALLLLSVHKQEHEKDSLFALLTDAELVETPLVEELLPST